jgi:hypothetical protein
MEHTNLPVGTEQCKKALEYESSHLGRDLLDLLEGEDGVDGEGLPLVPGEGPTAAAAPLSSPANHSLKIQHTELDRLKVKNHRIVDQEETVFT